MTERYFRKAALCAAFLFVFGLHASTGLASISVSPVRVDLSDEHTKDVVRVSNLEEKSKSYQVEVVSWTQTDERREVYSPTEELLAVPPLFTLEPGEEQLVRVGMLTEAAPNIERSYRMFITEIAPPAEEVDAQFGLNMRLQIGIPVFVAPGTAFPTSTLDVVDSMQIDNQLFVRFRNNGNTHVKITEVQYAAPGSSVKSITPQVYYLLPGRTGYLPVELPEGKPVGTVTVVTDGLGSLEYELPVAP